jgi:hypothetical protein
MESSSGVRIFSGFKRDQAVKSLKKRNFYSFSDNFSIAFCVINMLKHAFKTVLEKISNDMAGYGEKIVTWYVEILLNVTCTTK